MTIPGKIDDIKTIKADIRSAIVAKGVTVATNTAFADYPSKISQIEGGGEPVLQDKTLTVSSTTPTVASMTADSGYDGIDTATVDMTYVEDEFDDILGGDTVPIGGIPREVSANGKYRMPASNFTFSLPSNATDLDNYALGGAFRQCNSLTSVDLSSLTTVSGEGAMSGTFIGCRSLTSISFPNLATVSGYSAMSSVFSDCSNLTSISFPSLTTVSGYSAMYRTFYNCRGLTSMSFPSLTTVYMNKAMDHAFEGCTGLTSISFPSLTTLGGYNAMGHTFFGCTSLTSVDLSSLNTISGGGAMYCTFYGCTSLSSLSFPSLNSNSFGSNTDQFNGMLYEVTGCTVHFPSNLQAVIGSWASVTAGFGGTNTTVLFDLPATT